MLYFLSVLVGIGFSFASVEFQVSTPETPVTAVYGQYTVLTCSFPVNAEIGLDKLVINWQRLSTEEVVYSYYYGKGQLSRQSPRYSGRTSLFPEDITNGNASLRLDSVKLEDAGQYLCYVSSLKASGQGIVSLTFAEEKVDDVPTRDKWMLALALIILEFGIILILAKAVWRKEGSQQRTEL
ncbi:CD276 antigen-like isoform X2 [Mobula hypostoma]|uniref:CD276 antigen-like isoform X2 n=1 Tax=Mobula hypostoma TaxID=723540 RepID=UPI002FC33697